MIFILKIYSVSSYFFYESLNISYILSHTRADALTYDITYFIIHNLASHVIYVGSSAELDIAAPTTGRLSDAFTY